MKRKHNTDDSHTKTFFDGRTLHLFAHKERESSVCAWVCSEQRRASNNSHVFVFLLLLMKIDCHTNPESESKAKQISTIWLYLWHRWKTPKETF